MTQMMRRFLIHVALYAAILVLLCASRVSLAQSDGPPPPTSELASPPLVAVDPEPKPFVSVPDSLKDPAFDKFIDFKMLSLAYMSMDASAMTDVALQLREGERVLLRSHVTLRVGAIIDLALKIAAEKGDTATLERIGKFAEVINDESLSDRVKLSLQMASSPRAAAPTIPEPDETMPDEDVASSHSILSRLERARTIGDVQGLKDLQTELKSMPKTGGSLFAFVEKQVADAIAETEVDENSGETASMLRKLIAPSRGRCDGPYLEGSVAANGKTVTVREGAMEFYVNTETDQIWFPDAPPSWGWVPRNSAYGLKGRFGVTYIPNAWLQLDSANTKYYKPYYPDGQAPNVQNQDWVQVAAWNSNKNAWDYSWCGLKDVAPLTFKNLPKAVPKSANQIVAAGGGNITVSLPPNIVAAGGGNIVAAGGGNIVAAGGGNVIDGTKIKLSMLAPIVAAGGGNIKNANTVDLISKGGAGLSGRKLLSTSKLPPKSETAWANAPRN